MGLFSWFKRQPKIVEIKNFSKIIGFNFDLLIFEGWEVGTSEVTDDESGFETTCIIPIIPNSYYNEFTKPLIKVIKSERLLNADTTMFKRNPNNIPYNYIRTFENKVIISFHSDEFIVEVYPFVYENNGFSEKLFSEKVIESFKWA
jgi:hypothetical protein